jgi:hypothetical protein
MTNLAAQAEAANTAVATASVPICQHSNLNLEELAPLMLCQWVNSVGGGDSYA